MIRPPRRWAGGALGLLLASFNPAAAMAGPQAAAPPAVPRPVVEAGEAQPDIVVLAPWQGIPQPRGKDEEGLWMLADDEERQLAQSARRLRDPALEAHVKEVLCRAVGPERCGDVRIYVMRMPLFNAAMRPNGAMEVWTGLFFRTASDDELAVVLAHEFAHFEKRHALNAYQRLRKSANSAAWVSILGVPLIPELSLLAGFTSFSRDQEKEADLLSLAYLKQAGWSAEAGTRLWSRLIGEARATAVARGQPPDRLLKSGMFDTHPDMRDRAAYLKPAEVEALSDPKLEDVARYRAAIRAIMPEILQDQFGRNDFGGTDYILDQLLAIAPDPDLLLAKGELYRRRGSPRDMELAIPLYRAALAMPGARPEAWRGLGLALVRSGARQEGVCAVRTYLAARPDAPDAALLSSMIKDDPPCAP
ncbi:M48 family metalloprotease [Thermaurantiacus sp.]